MKPFAYAVLLSRTSGLFRSAGRGGPLWRGKACRPECSRRYGHVWMACLAAVFVALGLSATMKWADSYRRRFRWGNYAFLRRLWPSTSENGVVSATTRSFLDPSLSNVSRYYAGSCCRPVHSKSIRDKQVIFPIVFSLSSGAALAVFCFLGAYPTQSFTNSISALAGWNTYCTGMKWTVNCNI